MNIASQNDEPMLRFLINYHKCIEGIQLLAFHRPGISQYYVGKIFFFADRKHLLDWGRPISGDRYVAMQHGPVPSTIYDLLKDTSGEPDELVDALLQRINVKVDGNRIRVFSREANPNFRTLSRTDEECLLDALATYGHMSFEQLRAFSHQDRAYEGAWAQPGLNNEMDLRLWFDGQPEMLTEVFETAAVRRPTRQSFRTAE